MSRVLSKDYDVIITGGGVIGVGTARDCTMHGLRVPLIEKYDFSNDATGRSHGLLHSGARYAVTDPESTPGCIKENMILRRIAHHCIKAIDGLLITLPEDGIQYQRTFVESCQEASTSADIISPEEARRVEPSVNPDLIGAVRVPDASTDPFHLTTANILDVRRCGAEILTHQQIAGLVLSNGCVEGVRLCNNHTGEESEVRSRIATNAAGIWGHDIVKMAGIEVSMFPVKGTLLIFGHCVNNTVTSRRRKSASADILVPDDTVCVIGTTSDRVAYDIIDDLKIIQEGVDVLIKEGEKLASSLATTRIPRAYAGVRPFVVAGNDPLGRSISRSIICLDHETRDGLAGLITITGGRMMAHRLTAEITTDLACKKLGVEAACRTVIPPPPGSERQDTDNKHYIYSTAHCAAKGRQGYCVQGILDQSVEDRSLARECEEVSVSEIKYVMEKLHTHDPLNLRRRTRVGMGTCQGELCACRAAGIICDAGDEAEKTLIDLHNFINERWKGMKPVAWGGTLDEVQLTAAIYQGLLRLDNE